MATTAHPHPEAFKDGYDFGFAEGVKSMSPQPTTMDTPFQSEEPIGDNLDQTGEEFIEQIKKLPVSHPDTLRGKVDEQFLLARATRADKWDEQIDAILSLIAQERERWESDIETMLPEHEASLHIQHNAHKGNYETIEAYTDWCKVHDEDWATPTSKQRAIATDSLWEIQWYPNSPVGFNVIYGATLQEVISASTDKRKE